MVTSHRSLIAATLGAVLLNAVPSVAQDRLFRNGEEFGAHGRFGQRLGPSGGLDLPLAGGGRFAVTGTDVVDLRTTARRPLPTGAVLVAADPARAQLILSLAGTGRAGTLDLALFDIVSASVDRLLVDVCQASFFGVPVALARAAYGADGQVLAAMRCDDLTMARDVVVVDVGTRPTPPRVVLPVATTPDAELEVSTDGTRLFVMTRGSAPELAAYDTATGQLVGTAGVVGQPRWHDAIDTLVVTADLGFVDTRRVSAFGRNLEPIGAVDFTTRICGVTIQASPHTGRIYVTTNGSRRTIAEPVRLEVFEGSPLRSTGVAFPPDLGGPETCDGFVVRTAPGAPRDLRASVSGRELTLDWRNIGGASAFLLDVGLAPGRTDLSVPLGPDSRANFSGVPPGTYYLRLRGGNEFGGGRPSSELRVVVP